MSIGMDACVGFGLKVCETCARNLDNCSPEVAAMKHSMVRAPEGGRCGSYVAEQKKDVRER